jgi:hypothetical protein
MDQPPSKKESDGTIMVLMIGVWMNQLMELR